MELPLNTIICGDNLEVMRGFPANCIDTIITDPPAGISFMSKSWDSNRGSRDKWILWLTEIMAECLRVTKPGGALLCWSIPRTSHWTGMAIENAGWRIIDKIAHIYGSGFPKSHNISKAIDKAKGIKPIGRKEPTGGITGGHNTGATEKGWHNINNALIMPETQTGLAKLWGGYGTALKPSREDWWLAYKPLDGTFAANAETWGVAGLNIDLGRIGTKIMGGGTMPDLRDVGRMSKEAIGIDKLSFGQTSGAKRKPHPVSQGRWPANLILDEEAAAMLDEQSGVSGSGKRTVGGTPRKTEGFVCTGSPDRTNAVMNIGDSGGASRFFKIVKKEKICVLCDLTTESQDSIIKKKGDLLCNAKNVEKSLSQTEKGNYSATNAALQKAQPNEEAKSAKSNNSVHSAATGLSNTQAINGNIVQKPVKAKAIEKLALNAKSAGNLCERCATAIAQSIVAIKQGRFQELHHILDYICDYKRCILIQNLVSFAELWENIDIIPTTRSLSILFGSVNLAIINYIPETKKSEPSRFRYQPKASRAERNRGLEGMEATLFSKAEKGMKAKPKQVHMKSGDPIKGNIPMMQNAHPTVKPLKLMEYLCNLTKTPTGGIVLDPFGGSGTTAVACIRTGREYIVIEQDPGYCEIARRRADYEQKQGQLGLF